MLGSNIFGSCCTTCCANHYRSGIDPATDLPDQIFFEYSGIPSFIEPSYKVYDHFDDWYACNTQGAYEVTSTHPTVSWSGVLNRLEINGVKKNEYFKYFPEGERQSFFVNVKYPPLRDIDGNEYPQNFTREFQIVAAYVAQIRVSTTNKGSYNGGIIKVIKNPSGDTSNELHWQKNCDCPSSNCCFEHGEPGCGSKPCFKDYPVNQKCLANDGLPVTGSCFVSHTTGGCDRTGCCSFVCDQPGYEHCCNTGWTQDCVELASQRCGRLCESDGITRHPCEEAVCAQDPICCISGWDDGCVMIAKSLQVCNCPTDADNYYYEQEEYSTTVHDDAGYAWFADIIVEHKLDEQNYDNNQFTGGMHLETYYRNYEKIEENRFTSVRWITDFVEGGDQRYYNDHSYPRFLNLEDFKNSLITNDSQRKQYLVPGRVDEAKICGFGEFNDEYHDSFVTEFLDRNRYFDPCHPEIVTHTYPSSPIRNNDDELTLAFTQGDLKLPYGVYKLNIAEVNPYFKIAACYCGQECDPRICQAPNCSCCSSDLLPKCPCDRDCEAAVCAADAFCCSRQWDAACALKARELCSCGHPEYGCGGTATGSCFETHGSPYCKDTGCCQTVCAFMPDCCDTGWTQECVDLANFFCGSDGNNNPNSFAPPPSGSIPQFCHDKEYYKGEQNLYTNPNCGVLDNPDTSCGFKYECSGSRTSPYGAGTAGNLITSSAINWKCGYNVLNRLDCSNSATERSIGGIFASTYLPEQPIIELYKDSNTSSKYCYKFDGSGDIKDCATYGGANCPVPFTNFPIIVPGTFLPGPRELLPSLFATSVTIRISPV